MIRILILLFMQMQQFLKHLIYVALTELAGRHHKRQTGKARKISTHSLPGDESGGQMEEIVSPIDIQSLLGYFSHGRGLGFMILFWLLFLSLRQTPGRSNLRKDICCGSLFRRVQSFMAGKAWQRGSMAVAVWS